MKSSRLVTISSKVYYAQIYLLDSNFIYIILDFQLDCMNFFEISHFMHVANPTIDIRAICVFKKKFTIFLLVGLTK
jgi:hypothetical protein